MAEYASISMNIPKYPWKCSNNLFWPCQGSEYARSSNMFDRFLKILWVPNIPGFWVWHGCLCKDYIEFWICRNMSPYTLMSLSMSEHGWIMVDVPGIPENLWINCSDYARVLNMPYHLRYLRGFWLCLRH